MLQVPEIYSQVSMHGVCAARTGTLQILIRCMQKPEKAPLVTSSKHTGDKKRVDYRSLPQLQAPLNLGKMSLVNISRKYGDDLEQCS